MGMLGSAQVVLPVRLLFQEQRPQRSLLLLLALLPIGCSVRKMLLLGFLHLGLPIQLLRPKRVALSCLLLRELL